MKYNRNHIEELDPRQLIYIDYHKDEYGTQNLVINGKTYKDRTDANEPTVTKEILKGYEDREVYLWNNLRGWAIVFRTETNEELFNWDILKKLN